MLLISNLNFFKKQECRFLPFRRICIPKTTLFFNSNISAIYLIYNTIQNSSCFFFCKDTNFLANHNEKLLTSLGIPVVSSFAKILIFQLITTELKTSYDRYGCFFFCKDTNFLANHNSIATLRRFSSVVSSFAKILIFQLITTLLALVEQTFALFLLLQRY